MPRHAISFALLATLMAATRLHHFAALPDASWAVFFAGGFFLRTSWRWVFPALTVLAIAVDGYVISSYGQNFFSHYCMSVAYWFLIPTHAALWLGGAWLSQRDTQRWPALGALAAALLAAVSVAYLVSNGSFYWLADGWLSPDRERSLGGWMLNLSHWYMPYLKTTAMYVAGFALLHVLVRAMWPAKAVASVQSTSL